MEFSNQCFLRLAFIFSVSFSMNHLDECITNTRKVENFHNKMQEDLKKKKTFLQREDFDAAKFRKLTTNFEALNPGRLVKETFENQLLFIHLLNISIKNWIKVD